MNFTDWKYYFSDEQLDEGHELYRKEAVKGFVHTNTTGMARVLDDHVYLVKISCMSDGGLNMQCNCQMGQNGENCAHMAAVMWQWYADVYGVEDDEANEEEPIVEIENDADHYDPFAGYASDEYRYFDIRRMTRDILITPEALRQAKAMLSDHTMKLNRVNIGYGLFDRSEEMQGILSAQYTGRQKLHSSYYYDGTSVTLFFNRHTIKQGLCEVCGKRTFYTYGDTSACAHQTAAMLQLAQYIKQYNPGDATDPCGDRFLGLFGQTASVQVDADASGGRREVIHLAPRIIRENDQLFLSFKIGRGRMYVIRNLTDFVETVERRGAMKLGKKETLQFSEETFAPDSLDYYRMIQDKVYEGLRQNERLQQRSIYNMPDISLKADFPLEGENIDRLCELLGSRPVEYHDKDDVDLSKSLVFTEHLPKIDLYLFPLADETDDGEVDSREDSALTFTMSEEDRDKLDPILDEDHRLADQVKMTVTPENFAGFCLVGKVPLAVRGIRYTYLLTNGRLSKVEEQKAAALKPVFDTAEDGVLITRFGRKHLAELYYRALPKLEDNASVTIHDLAEDFIASVLPPEVHFLFRLDLNQENIFCQAFATYEGHDDIELTPSKNSAEAPAIWRDPMQEGRALETVQEEFPLYNTNRQVFEEVRNDDTVFNLLDTGIAELERIGDVEGSDAFRRLTIRNVPQVRVGVSVQSDLMDLEVKSSELSPDELLEVLESYRKKKRYHKLRSGEYVRLEQDDSIEMLSDMMDSLGIDINAFTDGKMHLPMYRALYINRMLEDHDEVAADRDKQFRSLIKNFKTVRDSDDEVPESLKNVMRNYQVYGYKWLRTLARYGFGGILADDMGLGKTLQMISVLLADKEERLSSGQPSVSLIVCPASLVYNWQEEFEKFAPSLRVTTVAGTAAARKQILSELSDTDVLVTSYDLLKRDVKLYNKYVFNYMVLDEAQYIKNQTAAVSKAVKIIHSKHRFALTGTPIENRLSELWSIFDFLMPGFLYTYQQFKAEFETPITKYQDEEATERLRRMTGPFILRRLKEDVLKDLPPKLEEVRYARMEDEQRKLYDAQVVHMKQMVEASGDNYNQDKIRILTELTRIRQICCDPSLVFADYHGPSAKREACLDMIRSAIDGGHRMLIFSQFTSMLSLLEEDLKREKIEYYLITGATPKKERLNLVHAFNDGNVPVFLISLKAGGTGLNLTGADVVIHYDPWWNLSAQNQATDRAHRIGQTKQVSVFRLIMKDTIEEKILKMQETKKDLSDAILSGETASLSSMTREELLDLLG